MKHRFQVTPLENRLLLDADFGSLLFDEYDLMESELSHDHTDEANHLDNTAELMALSTLQWEDTQKPLEKSLEFFKDFYSKQSTVSSIEEPGIHFLGSQSMLKNTENNAYVGFLALVGTASSASLDFYFRHRNGIESKESENGHFKIEGNAILKAESSQELNDTELHICAKDEKKVIEEKKFFIEILSEK
jgi:hypothetical protein